MGGPDLLGRHALCCAVHPASLPRLLTPPSHPPIGAPWQVLFLSKLIQAHLSLADKLGTMQLPLL